MTGTITETFNKSADGWTVIGDVQSSGWEAKGGDAKGYLGWVDAATGQDSYYQAGPKFLGDKIHFYGGTLSYDILDTGNGYTAYDVQIEGDGKTLQYTNPNDGSFPTPNVWSAASVLLVAGNFIDTATGLAPTVKEMKDVMKDMTQLDIRAEYVNGAESGGLDNVIMTSPAAPIFDGVLPGISMPHHVGIGTDTAPFLSAHGAL
jgi:Laminin B (Domain IV)